MFTDEGLEEYRKYEKWISDENYQISPDFVPGNDTPQEAVDYYKRIVTSLFPMFDFDAPDFSWPTGIGINL